MKLTIDKRYWLDSLILVMIFLQIAIFNYLNLSKLGNWILFVLIIFRLLLSVNIKKRKRFLLFAALGTFSIYMLGTISALAGAFFRFGAFRSNLMSMTYPLLITIYIAFICMYNKEVVRKFFNNNFYAFNIYFLINVIVLILQVRIPDFMAGYANWVNYYRKDLISGLFGYSGTHQLGFFSSFIILYNLYYTKYVCKKKYRVAMNAYTAFLMLFVMIMSSLNDNKMQYVMLALFLYAYVEINISDGKSESRRVVQRLKFVFAIIAVLVALIVTYFRVDFVKHIFDSSILKIVKKMMEILNSKDSLITGGAERIYMIRFAFTKFNGLTTGYGLGTYWWQTSTALGFSQFGQADLGTFLCLAGLVFTVPCMAFYYLLYKCICGLNGRKHMVFVKLAVLVIELVAAIYTTPMKNSTIQICFLLNLIVMNLCIEEKFDNCSGAIISNSAT